MRFLREIRMVKDNGEFPFSLPLFRDFDTLSLDAPITFLVGENGCGKSTLLEIVAAALRLPGLTQRSIETHPLMEVAREAAAGFRFVRQGAGWRGFYFRADDVTGFLQSIRRNAEEHGELFLALFQARLTAPGLYLLDEPEGPLSPTNQIALIAMIRDAVSEGSQFLIATHSPILMALRGAVILDMDVSPPRPIAWDDVEHVAITRAFLSHPDSFLSWL